MKLGAKIFGALAGILILFLLTGVLLPGTWEAEVETAIPAPPSVVFPYLDLTDQWVRWNPMPESGSKFVGPARGAGAGIDWDDPQYGEGQFRILSQEMERYLEYEVRIEGGSLVIRGAVSLTAEGDDTRLRWVEQGDFGWNPLLGFAARSMGSSQAEVMRGKLDALSDLIATDRTQGRVRAPGPTLPGTS